MSDTNWILRAVAIMDTSYYLSSYWITLTDHNISKLLNTLYDQEIEVRKAASAGISKIILLLKESEAEKIIGELKARAIEGAKSEANVVEFHGSVLGLTAFVQAQSLGITKWTPDILMFLSKYSNNRGIVSDSVRICFSTFWKAHKTTWEYEKSKFTEEQQESLLEHINPYGYFA